jgi:hypothetical protein
MAIGYFKIKEEINCGACNAINDASLLNCSYCGINMRAEAPSSTILLFKDKMDAAFMNEDICAVKVLINQVVELDHPIIKFRQLILELNDMISGGSLLAPLFRKQLERLNSLIESNSNYFQAYMRYVQNILPVDGCTLNAEDYRSIVSHGLLLQYDIHDFIGHALRLQFATSSLGINEVKEIQFYLDPINQIGDSSFEKRKQYLLNIYNEATQIL